MVERREQLLEIMEDAARGETKATLRDRIAELEAEVERLREQVEVANFAVRNGESLSSDAIHEIRELLKAHDVPVATFIDDHVRNAIVQRNQERTRAEAAEARIAELEAENERLRKALDALDRMNLGLDWCDQDEQARRWSAARRALKEKQR